MTTAAASPSWSVDRRFGFVSFLVAVGIAGLGWWLSTFHELGGYGVEVDFYYQFHPAAQDILAGRPVANPRSGPGYPLLLAAGSYLTPDLFEFGKWVAVAAVALSGWFTFLCVRAFASAGTALVAQALLYATLFRYSVVVSNDMVFVALATGALACALRSQTPGVLGLILGGLLAGLAMTVRYPGIALIAALAGWLVFWPVAGTAWSRRARNLALFLVPALLGSAPSWASTQLGLSDKKESKTYALVAADCYGTPSERLSPVHIAKMETEFSSMWEVFTREPKRVAKFYAQDYYDDALMILKDSVTLPAFLFAGAGLLLWFAGGWADRRRAFAFLAYPLLMYGIVALVPYQARYGYPLVPATAALVAAALCHRWGADGGTEETSLARRVRLLCAAAVFFVPMAMSAWKTREYLTSEPVELFAAADALKPIANPGDRLIARKPNLNYLASLPNEFPKVHVDLATFLKWAKEEAKARFLLVGDWEVYTNSALAPLQKGEAPAGASIVWRHEATKQVLYDLGQ